MKKNILKGAFLIATIAFLTVFYVKTDLFSKQINSEFHEGYEEESEEEIAYERAMEKTAFPAELSFEPNNLQGKKLENYKALQKKLDKNGNKFSSEKQLSSYIKDAAINMATSMESQEYAYANNSLIGTWDQKHLDMNSTNGPGYSEGGFRADGAVYDPVNEELYVVSHGGHLYKIDESATIKWSLRNQKKNLRGEDFNGVNLTDGSFRLLHQKANGAMEFSDDEGRTWANANGALFENSWNFKTLVTKKDTGRRIVAHGGRYIAPNNIAYHRIYISNDNGLNYSTSLTTDHLKISEFDVQICKPHNSRTVYCFARRKSDSKVFMYRMQENDNDLTYMGQPVNLNGLESVLATEVNGTVHFYISFNETNIYYSNDEGVNWTQTSSTNSSRNVQEIHPTQPNICFKGFVDLNMSTDNGATWSTNQHRIGPSAPLDTHYVWDLQFIKTFDKENGGNFTFAGLDFGSYYTSTSDVWTSWISINRGNPTMLSYDAATSEKHNRIYSANQDRGAQSFLEDDGTDENYISPALREANTDILRVAIAKGGESAWFWYYFGNIGRASVVGGGNYTTVVRKDFYPNFAATSMIPSPDSNEDAVYIPWGAQLEKIAFIGGQIVRTFHPYTFSEPAHSFGYSGVNTNRWYAGLKSGPFMYSTDGGITFTQSNYSGTWPQSEGSHRKRRTVIATSPIDEATVYYAGKGNIFLISTDGGATFTSHTNGLNVDRIVDMEASVDGKFIFAACEFDGAWVFSVQENQWYKMDGADVPSLIGFTDVQYIDATNIVRFATYGSGILDFKITSNVDNTPASGLYIIEQIGSGKCMNIYQSGGNGAAAQQNTCLEDDNFKFNLEKQSDGTYKIKASYNNKSLTVPEAPVNRSFVTINDDINQTNQRFTIENVGNGNYKIGLVNSPGKALAIAGSRLDDNEEPVIVWDYFNASNYHWKFTQSSTLSNNNPDESVTKSIKIYPNPVSDSFNISLDGFENPNVIINDMLGKIIYHNKTSSNDINLSKNLGFSTGMYIIKVTGQDGKTYNNKFIIK